MTPEIEAASAAADAAAQAVTDFNFRGGPAAELIRLCAKYKATHERVHDIYGAAGIGTGSQGQFTLNTGRRAFEEES